MSYTLIERRELSQAASSVVISSIPQIYTDLIALISARNTAGTNLSTLTFNSGGTYVNRWLNGTGSSTSTDVVKFDYLANPNDFTASTFASSTVYIPNYRGSTAKTFSLEGVSENNAIAANQVVGIGLWSGTEAINSITFTPGGGGNFVAGSSVSLYGINRQQAIGRSPQAVGGTIAQANGYWYHVFNGSGDFKPFNNLEVEYLVIAGGGGGGYQHGGGGGAGGFRTASATLSANTNYSVVIGAGGISNTNSSAPGDSGNASSFNSLSSTGGGGGGDRNSSPGASGGSGGGGGYFTAGGAGTAGQGNNGGSGNAHGGGGGGAGAQGVASTGTVAGNGGNGLPWLNGVFYAGGGGGGHQGTSSDPASLGGLGGGGNGSGIASGIAGSPNTGGGGGGSRYPGYSNAHGGSGVVIIRYKA